MVHPLLHNMLLLADWGNIGVYPDNKNFLMLDSSFQLMTLFWLVGLYCNVEYSVNESLLYKLI